LQRLQEDVIAMRDHRIRELEREQQRPDAIGRELHQRVLGYVARRVGSREDAEDIAQEVMLRIHRHSAELVHVERMSAWVYRVAGNAITDHYRRAARREVPSGQAADVPEPEPDTAASAWMEPDTDQLRQQLAACLAPLVERLSASYRHALELTELNGISQTEAAPRLGLSVSGMKTRVQRARGQLRDRLLECCQVELDRRRSVTDIRPRADGCETCGAHPR
jgi:RNA polymerase sigma-70 factor (ECF subfamily)